MKALRPLLVASLLALAAVAAVAQVEFKLTTNVPFSFTVADQTVPAGSSTFSVNSGRQRLTITGPKTRISVSGGHLVFKGDFREAFVTKRNELLFIRYGDERFLTEVWVNNQGMSVGKSKREMELVKAGIEGVPVKLVAKP